MKIQEILSSTRNEAHFRCSVSREIPPSLLTFEGSLTSRMQLKNFPKINLSRGIPRFPTQLKKTPSFPSSSRAEGPFSRFVEKGILAFLSHHKWRCSQLESRVECQGSWHHSKRPRLLGASIGDPTLDKVMWRDLMGKASQISWVLCLSIYSKAKICLYTV